MRREGVSTRVGFFTFRITEKPTGLANYARELTAALRALDTGIEIVLLNPHSESSLDWYQEFPTYNLKLPWQPSSAWFPALAAPLTLARAARELRLDIIHAPANVAPFIGPQLGIMRVATIHDVAPLVLPDEHRIVSRLANAVMVPPLRWTADAVLTVSEAAAGDLVARAHLPEEMVHVTPNGVTSPTEAQLKEWRSVPIHIGNLADDTSYVLAVGDIRPRKNLRRVIEAFERIAILHPHVKLVLVGQQMHEAAVVRDAAEKMAGTIIQTGYVDEETKHRLYANAVALVIPSLYEGFGLPALEAMAHGLPVVASDYGALKEVVGDAGILVDPYSVESIAGGIAGVLGNPGFAASMADRGRQRAATFTWRNTALKTLEVYRGLGVS